MKRSNRTLSAASTQPESRRSSTRTVLLTTLLTTLISLLMMPLGAQAQRQPTIPTSGTFRVLVVPIQFQDDTFVFGGRTPAGQAWLYPNTEPTFTHDLLAQTPMPPFAPNSLTDFYYQQSLHTFIVYGDVYPNVYVTQHEEQHYSLNKSMLHKGTLTEEIMAALNADPDLDLSEYDANADGFIDHIFFVIRRFNTLNLERGSSGISLTGYNSQHPEFGNGPSRLLKMDQGLSGSYILYGNAGNAIPDVNLVGLMAHEFGHDLWMKRGISSHLHNFKERHGVPRRQNNRLGYAMMLGSGGGDDMGGDEIISAFERDLLGWIDCIDLTESTTVVVKDLYSAWAMNCYRIRLAPNTAVGDRTLYLSNRQRVGYFDQVHSLQAPFNPSEEGLKTTGLLATVAKKSGHYAVIAADQDIEKGSFCDVYEGDLFGPETMTQLTPWTRPSVNGYSYNPDHLIYDDRYFQAIDRIRYTGGADGEMAFDYVSDFRNAPVIRDDSWMGVETAGHTFTGDVVVTNGATLTVETDITIEGTLRLEDDARVVITRDASVTLSESAHLSVEQGTQMTVEGTFYLYGTVDASWRDMLHTLGAGVISPTPTGTEGSQDVPGGFSLSAYPNPFNPTAQITYTLPVPGPVNLSAYDVTGRTVAVLEDAYQSAGSHSVRWDAASHLASGTYFVRLVTEAGAKTFTLVLAR